MKLTLQQRFEAKITREPTSGCWLWMGTREASGYGHFSVDRRRMRAHRMAWTLYRGEIPPGKFVCHHCDVPECVNPDHLFLGTPQENSTDMKRKGRHRRGEQHHAARLTRNQVDEIRKLLKEGKLLQREIAALYGICCETVGNIKRGKNWRQQPSPDAIAPPAEPQTPAADERGSEAAVIRSIPFGVSASSDPCHQRTSAVRFVFQAPNSTRVHMAEFSPAFEFVMQHEDASRSGRVTEDAGGRTRFGIAGKFHPELPETFFTGPADAALKTAEEILSRDYWLPMRFAEVLDQKLANKLFDMAVNMGVHQAAIYAQRAVNGLIIAARALSASEHNNPVVGTQPPGSPARDGFSRDESHSFLPVTPIAEDGVVGPRTLAALNAADPAKLYALLCEWSRRHYEHVAAINPAQAVNLAGWLKRANA